jgi:hypothetical protein
MVTDTFRSFCSQPAFRPPSPDPLCEYPSYMAYMSPLWIPTTDWWLGDNTSTATITYAGWGSTASRNQSTSPAASPENVVKCLNQHNDHHQPERPVLFSFRLPLHLVAAGRVQLHHL